jgi:hypothetical protein
VDERLRVEADDLTIEIDVRVRRGERGHREARWAHGDRPAAAASATQYETYLRANAGALAALTASLGAGRDPFEIQQSLAGISTVADGDVESLTVLHASALHKLDAFMTMLQKELGDRADIVQMVAWHAELCSGSVVLQGLPSTGDTKTLLGGFLAAVDSRSIQLSDYRALLGRLDADLRACAAELGASGALVPLIDAIRTATSVRAAQKAHRAYLLELAARV